MSHGLAFSAHWVLVHVWNATHITFSYQVALYTSALAFLSVTFAQNNPGWRVSHDYLRKKHHSLLAFAVLKRIFGATNTLLEQAANYVRLSWREHSVIRHPSGRHPVFTGKPLKPGLMRSKHDSLATCGWWLSGPFPFSPLLRFFRHQWPFKRASEAEMRVVLLDWAALNQRDIYSSSAVALLLSGSTLSLPPMLRAGWAQHILIWGRHPILAALYLFEEAIVPPFGNYKEFWSNCWGWHRFQGQNPRTGLF